MPIKSMKSVNVNDFNLLNNKDIKVGDSTVTLFGTATAHVVNVSDSFPITSCQISPQQAEKIHANRIEIPVPEKKNYQGINRLNQLLRHVATSIYDEANRVSRGMGEVQCALYNGKIHLSSNFKSDSIHKFLHKCLNKKRPEAKFRPNDFEGKKVGIQEAMSRANRHKAKLLDFTNENGKKFNRILTQMKVEILHGQGVLEGRSISTDQIVTQAEAMLKTLLDGLLKAKEGDFSLVEIHASQYGDPNPALHQTMHAEQSIETHISFTQEEIKQSGQDVILPMAGRFVPCAVCHEVENSAKKTGIFKEGNGLILHRASDRSGQVFSGGTQYLANEVLADGKGAEIVQNLTNNPSKLSSYLAEIVFIHSFDTASGSEPE